MTRWSALAFLAILVACPGPEPQLRPGATTTASHGGAGAGAGGMGGSGGGGGGGGHGGGDLCDKDEVKACGTCFQPLAAFEPSINLSVVLDWDADGDMDIAGLGSGQILNVLLADPPGVFLPAMPLPPPINFGRYGQFTGDDLPDSIVVYEGTKIGYRENLGGGMLDMDIEYVDTQINPKYFVIGDIDGDGLDDAVLLRCNAMNCMSPVTWPVYIATGMGGTTPFVTPAPTVSADPTLVGGLVTLTNDAFADLVALDAGDDELQIYINESGSLPDMPMTVEIEPHGLTPNGLSVKDIDGDGGLELAITHAAPGSDVAIMTSTTRGAISARTSVPVEGGQHSPALVDLDGNGHVDLVVVAALPNNVNEVVVACGNATGFDAPQLISDDPSLGRYMIVEDIDGDGAPDIAIRTTAGIGLFMSSP